MKRKIGTLTLKRRHEFTQYSECAAWTDYVTCEPQTVDLFSYDDGYWVGGAFAGILTQTTFPPGSRTVGAATSAGVQTQRFGGIGDWMDGELFSVTITDPSLVLAQVGVYGDGCGERAGKPMMALQPASREDDGHVDAGELATMPGYDC